MDPIEILTNVDKVIPFFQPIFSADERMVMGYEVLGRIQYNDEYESLGAFFQDETIPDEYRLEIDDIIVKKAIEYWITNETKPYLFLNRNPNLLMKDNGESLLKLLLSYQEKGLLLDHIIIEISEHDFNGDIEQLNHLLLYYRTYGLKVAVDNVGNGAGNFDRMNLLSPDILKVDLHMLRKTNDRTSYQEVLYSLSLLARKIGAILLYQDIETMYQLQYAWQNGGRYYQGFYLSKPNSEFIQPDILKDQLNREMKQFIEFEKKKIQSVYHISVKIQQEIQKVLGKNKKSLEGNELLYEISKQLSYCSFRMYICDEDGFQQSSNYVKTEIGWTQQPSYLHKNWSWRPYFLENIMRMKLEKQGILSDSYSDIETGETIRTFSYPVNQHQFLFIDLTYEFLYDEGVIF
ncbi:EAL-associated domain-containing protein [Bacillus salitolerans]|uniref:EAL-associated domain-containing protein n=1 Tax=Bacillus salitolerans TaxID=1437434 RepID=A0ABW4LKH5_9BACI